MYLIDFSDDVFASLKTVDIEGTDLQDNLFEATRFSAGDSTSAFGTHYDLLCQAEWVFLLLVMPILSMTS